MSVKTVAKHLQLDYRQFASDPDPFNLQGEIAALRTLLIEVRESLEDSTVAKQLQFANAVEATTVAILRDEEGWDENEAQVLGARLADIAAQVQADVYGIKARISPKDAVDIAKVVESLSKVAERYKKMVEGVTLNVKYDNELVDMMSKFVVHVMMRYIPVDRRNQVAAAARAFLPSATGLNEGIDYSQVYEEPPRIVGHHNRSEQDPVKAMSRVTIPQEDDEDEQ